MKSLVVLIAMSWFGPFTGYARFSIDDGITIHGRLLDLRTRTLVSANVDIFCNSDFVKSFSSKVSRGEFTAPLDTYGMYIISITSPGYVDVTDTVWVINEKRKRIDKDFYLAPVQVGLTVALNNIYFDFGKTSLSDQSLPELEKTTDFFKENPGTTFEIGGHTDRNGPDDYNLILSQARAQAVVDYFVDHGVARTQLVAHGYGESNPLDISGTREAEARNRRVEIKVLHMALTSKK
jgi:outer membrane protein OmpA-like peptidoglycan-associated protein